MLFSVGVETPKDDNTAFGLVVPALCNDEYGCFSAVDSVDDIYPMAQEAIALVLSDMAERGFSLEQIKDEGYLTYSKQEDYTHCDSWLLIEVDASEYMGKKQRINISVPDYLLRRIDQRVSSNPRYKDRSHFLAVAAEHELSGT